MFPALAARDDDTNAKFTTPAGTFRVMYTLARDVVVRVQPDIERVMDVGRLAIIILLVDVEVSVEEDNTTATDAPLVTWMD